jgi:probable phosphoglycerate mutase
MTVTKLLLVRHGHVEGIAPLRFRGRAELPLTPLGLRQAEAVATRIHRSWQLDALYCSPMGRCVATATAIGSLFGLSPVALSGLNDIHYGQWQGLSPEEAEKNWPDAVQTWFQRPDWAAIPDGENLHDVLARCAAALREIIQRHAGTTVALVGHDSVNRVILLHILGLPLSRYRHIDQSPCALNEIDYVENDFYIRSINQTDHLLDI